jgi:hypothetical protein
MIEESGHVPTNFRPAGFSRAGMAVPQARSDTEQPRPVLLQPEYAGPQTHPRTSRTAVHVALFCGLAPLILGIAIFVGWIITRNDTLEELGFLDILFGLGCTMIGVIAVIVQFYHIPGSDLLFLRRFVSETWTAILLLTINFPVCWQILRSVDYIETSYPHRVYNPDRGD